MSVMDRGECSLRLDKADALAAHFGLELRPVKAKRKGRKSVQTDRLTSIQLLELPRPTRRPIGDANAGH